MQGGLQRNHTETRLRRCNKALFRDYLASISSSLCYKKHAGCIAIPFLLAVTCKQLQKSFSVVARATIFTLHKHTTHSECTSRWCKAICNQQHSLTFDKTTKLFMPCFILYHCSRLWCEYESHYLTFPYLCSSLVFLTDFSPALLFFISLFLPLLYIISHSQASPSVNLKILAYICCAMQQPADSINMCEHAGWMLD